MIALSEPEAAKISSHDTRSDIGSEAAKLTFANAITSLVVTLFRLDYDGENSWDLLVMERLYALDYRSVEIEKRELWLDVFEDKLKPLHAAGFVHRKLRRPSNIPRERFGNIILTASGLRLIDASKSALRQQVGDKLFAKYVAVELQGLGLFKAFFLNR